jgi:chromosome segregation ATPase
LNSKRLHYVQKVQKSEENILSKKKLIEENNQKLQVIENEYKRLIEDLGDSYIKQKFQNKITKVINIKEKKKKIIEKEVNSKINVMNHKIKELQDELKTLKENELRINTLLWDASEKINQYQERIKLTPIFKKIQVFPEHRSYSVHPKMHSSFLTEV